MAERQAEAELEEGDAETEADGPSEPIRELTDAEREGFEIGFRRGVAARARSDGAPPPASLIVIGSASRRKGARHEADVVSLSHIWRGRESAPRSHPRRMPRLRGAVVLCAPFSPSKPNGAAPATSRNRRMQIVDALYEAAHPSDPAALVLSATERKMILELRGICPGWEKPKRKPSSEPPGGGVIGERCAELARRLLPARW
jgi:hypothetical protein